VQEVTGVTTPPQGAGQELKRADLALVRAAIASGSEKPRRQSARHYFRNLARYGSISSRNADGVMFVFSARSTTSPNNGKGAASGLPESTKVQTDMDHFVVGKGETHIGSKAHGPGQAPCRRVRIAHSPA